MPASPEEAAQDLLEVVPLVMRAVRREMRSRRSPDLSVPQFRAMAFLSRARGASLSQVADHMGLTLPSASKMMEVMVERNLVAREASPSDRRRIALSLTSTGSAMLEEARAHTRQRLSYLLAPLTDADREAISTAMAIIRPVFTPAGEASIQDPG